ncbi:MAG: AN1-type zinc finger domain-containing protein [Promethearchaeota archaeon]
MPECIFCGKDAGYLPFLCKFCGMTFCIKHRLPENHNCPFDLRSKEGISDKNYILYQDAFELMNNELTVDKIFYYVQSKQLNKNQATDLLGSFLENSNKVEVRKICLMAIKLLELKNDIIYQILENCLFSDEDIEVKRVAARVLASNFPIRSKDALKWAYEHDKNLS